MTIQLAIEIAILILKYGLPVVKDALDSIGKPEPSYEDILAIKEKLALEPEQY